MNIAFLSVIHPNAVPFLDKFLYSIATQTYKNFKLYLLNDGVDNFEEINSRFDLEILVKKITGSPSAIRKAGIEWVLRQGADIIVFADADDYFMDNRIETSVSLLSNCDIVFNELMIFDETVRQPYPMLSHRFKEGDEVCADHLKHSNCIGLGNSAINAKSITRLLSQVPDDIIAFDWAFFFLCLDGSEKKAVFTLNTATYYRQHSNSCASLRSFTESQILRGVRVKRDHYRFISRFVKGYEPLSKYYSLLLDNLQKDTKLRVNYCSQVSMKSPASPLWWESIKTLEELGL